MVGELPKTFSIPIVTALGFTYNFYTVDALVLFAMEALYLSSHLLCCYVPDDVIDTSNFKEFVD